LIRDEVDHARHVEYCYINPLKHGLERRVRDWPHLSFIAMRAPDRFGTIGPPRLRWTATSASAIDQLWT
jgi:REP-associated tyrosine transposase